MQQISFLFLLRSAGLVTSKMDLLTFFREVRLDA